MPFAFRRAIELEVVPWFLIAMTLPAFAIATWHLSDQTIEVQRWVTLSAAPVAAAEILFVLWAAGTGFAPIRQVLGAPRWLLATLALLLACALGTAIFVASDKSSAGLRGFLLLLHIVFGFSVAWLASRNATSILRLVWPAMVAGLVTYVLILVFYVAAVADPLTFKWRRFTLAASNIRHIGYYAAIGAAAALGLAASNKPLRFRLVYAGAATIFFALAFWSGSRGAPVAVWAACLLGLVWFPQLRSIRAGGILVACTLLGAVLSLIHTVPNRNFGLTRIQGSAFRDGADRISSGRLHMWEETWNAFLERPWFGHGQAQFRQMSQETLGITSNHPHNVLLQALFDWGIIGTVCLLLAAWFLFGRCIQVLKEPADLQLPAFLVGAALLTMAVYDGTTFYTYTLMVIALSIAWIIGVGGRPTQQST